MTATRRRLWPFVMAAACGIAILSGLGAWQVKRLHWKEQLIQAQLDSAAGEPHLLGDAILPTKSPGIEYMKVRFRASYDFAHEMRMLATLDGSAAWTIITPALTADGYGVLVDRGQVPADRPENYGKPAGEVEITGVTRRHDQGRGYFDADNDSASRTWHWWDLPAMRKEARFPAESQVYPLVVQLMPIPNNAAFPKPPPPASSLTNNHLGYALTWFGLAAVLFVMTILYICNQLRIPAA